MKRISQTFFTQSGTKPTLNEDIIKTKKAKIPQKEP